MPAPDIPWKELQAGINTANTFREQIAQKAANFACGLYRNYPSWAKGVGPAKDILDGLWGDLCAPRPGGISPGANPRGGGQCDGVAYLFRVQLRNVDGTWGAILGGGFGNDPFSYYGPIGGVTVKLTPDGTGSTVYLESRGSSGNAPLPYASRVFTNTSPAAGARVIELRRADGQPDNCGDYPGGYPGGGGTPSVIELSTNVPARLPSGIDVDVPIGFVAVNIEAGIQLTVGSIPVTIDFGGFTFAPEFDFGGGDGDGQGDGNTPPSHLPPTPSNYDEGDGGEGDSGEDEGIDKLKWVAISLVSIPKNAKTEYGANAPDVYYAGWFEWKAAGKCLPRQPIHFEDNVFLAPDGVDGYAYTVKQGYKASVKVYTEKETD